MFPQCTFLDGVFIPPSFYGNVQCTCADNSNTTPSSVYYGLLGNHSKPVPLLRLLEKHASRVCTCILLYQLMHRRILTW